MTELWCDTAVKLVMADPNLEPSFLKDFHIPNCILLPEAEVDVVGDIPKWPVIVFVNSKSGGQLGGDLLKTYRSLLNEHQVILVLCLY